MNKIHISDSKNRKIGLIISYISIIISIIISLLFTPFLLNNVGDRQYGIYSYSVSIATWLNTFLSAIAFGYTRFLMQEYKSKGNIGEKITLGCFFKIFLLITIFVVTIGTILFILGCNELIKIGQYTIQESTTILTMLFIFSLITGTSTILCTFKNYLFYKQKFIIIYSTELIGTAIQYGLSLLLLSLGKGVVALVLCQLISVVATNIITSLVSIFGLKEKVSLILKNDEQKKYSINLIKQILSFSTFIILEIVISNINKSVDVVILGYFNVDSISRYQIGFHMANYMILFVSALGNIFNAESNKIYLDKNGGIKGINKLYIKVSRIQFIFAFLIIGGFFSCGHEFITLWVSSDRIESYYIGSALMLIYSIFATNTISRYFKKIVNKQKIPIILIGLGCLINVLSSILFCYLFGNDKAVWACVAGTFISTVFENISLSIYDSRKLNLNVAKYYLNYLIVFLIASLSFACTFLLFCFVKLESLSLFLQFFIKGITYVAVYSLIVIAIYGKWIKKSFLTKRRIINEKNNIDD